TKLSVISNEIPAGQYEFAIYQWRFHGIREDLVLKPISSNTLVTEYFGRFLESAEDYPDEMPGETNASIWDELDAMHYSIWNDARNRHRKETQELAEYRRESLSTSHQARITLMEEQLSHANNEKIQ